MNKFPTFNFNNIVEALLTSYVLSNQDIYPIISSEHVIITYIT